VTDRRSLEDKVVLVTGGAGGIGSATCEVLGSAGARLLITDRAEAGGEVVAKELRDKGYQAIFVPANLTSEDEIKALVEAALDTYGRLDGAFNNAAVEQRNKPVDMLTLDEWNYAIQVNLTAVFLGIKYQAPAMIRSGGGSIVNTSSSLGQVGAANLPEYASAKHGIIGLTKAAGADLGPRGIRVNAILPGITLTPMIQRLTQDPDMAEAMKHLRKRHSLERFGQPNEIGESVAWLLSDKASFMNAAAIPVDGGYLSM
jgi:NAD(P)-dependent dehydrogenase (short-subunit alcohol dehydrogenase family)